MLVPAKESQIEVVPFFHKMAFLILAKVGDENPKAVLATTILSYSVSSVVTGAVFFVLGKCKLGALVGFFPRKIISCVPLPPRSIVFEDARCARLSQITQKPLPIKHC